MFASSLRTTIQKSAASFLPSSSVSPSLGGMDIHIRFRIEMDILDNLDINDEPPVRLTGGAFWIILFPDPKPQITGLRKIHPM